MSVFFLRTAPVPVPTPPRKKEDFVRFSTFEGKEYQEYQRVEVREDSGPHTTLGEVKVNVKVCDLDVPRVTHA